VTHHGVEQPIGTLRDSPSWPGRSVAHFNGPKIRLQSRPPPPQHLHALAPHGGGVQIPCYVKGSERYVTGSIIGAISPHKLVIDAQSEGVCTVR
jgi:hypothetical protein